MSDDETWFKYQTSEHLKKRQTELSRLANGITKQAQQPYFTPEEAEQLRAAVAVLDGFKTKVEHLKEKRARHEKRLERARRGDEILAARRLKAEIAPMTLAQKMILLANQDETSAWPANSFDDALMYLERNGLDSMLTQVKRRLTDWVNSVAGYMAYAANREEVNQAPEEISEESARRRIERTMRSRWRGEPQFTDSKLQAFLRLVEKKKANPPDKVSALVQRITENGV